MFRNLRLSTIGCAILAILVASVEAQQQPVAHHGRVRVHFIAAEEIDWDYAPLGRDEAMGHPFGEFEKNYVEAGPHRIGRIYKKVVYREYTDAKFNRLLTRSADEQYLGILGPVLYGEVGDTIKIFFKNNASRPFSMHPHGVLYQKNSEGSGCCSICSSICRGSRRPRSSAADKDRIGANSGMGGRYAGAVNPFTRLDRMEQHFLHPSKLYGV